MRSNYGVRALVLGAGVAALCTGACKKSADERERERGEAATTELRSARDRGGAKIETRVIDEKRDRVAAVRREQLELRAELERDIATIDGKLAEMKVELYEEGHPRRPRAKEAARFDELVDRRRQLQHDIVLIERADEHGWDDLKASIEHDLKSGRPRGRI